MDNVTLKGQYHGGKKLFGEICNPLTTFRLLIVPDLKSAGTTLKNVGVNVFFSFFQDETQFDQLQLAALLQKTGNITSKFRFFRFLANSICYLKHEIKSSRAVTLNTQPL